MTTFNQILKDIKNIKIQGAKNVAIAGLKALKIKNNSEAIKKILKTRPTEPLLKNSITFVKKDNKKIKQVLDHFKESQNKISELVNKKIKKNSTIFTHCHSSTVVKSLIYSKKKNFQVFNTETRPLFQGRKTTKELTKAKIKTIEIVDSAAAIALKKNKILRKTNIVLLGCDAILKDGSVINKVGSGMFAEIAYHHKIPVYIVTDAWKFTSRNIKIEERSFKEVWKRTCKKCKIKNPAFEKVEEKYITAIISELGILKPKKFVKKVKKVYSWIK
jgi:translation initiation factor 2B subunit (eIF-2B alpha/beta/delta family)